MATLTTQDATITERRPAVAEEILRTRKSDMPWEIHDGELIEMSPSGYRHLRVNSRILKLLFAFTGNRSDIEALGDGGGFLLQRNPDILLSPDSALVRTPPETPRVFGEFSPELAVEVRSPGDSLHDLRRKAALYLRHGSEQVWIVDAQRKLLEVHFPDGHTLEARDGIYTATGIAEGLKVDLREIFKDADEAEATSS
jgi:Uma2 family endonuclease